MRSCSYFALILAVSLALAGCGVDLSPAERATKNITDAASELKLGLTKLSEVDPAGIRGLVEKNEDLRKQLQSLTLQLSNAGLGTGVFELRDKRIYLEVIDYRGAFKLDSWIDDPKWWTLSNKELPDKSITLESYGLTRSALHQSTRDNGNDSCCTGLHEPGMKACFQVAENAFRSFLTTAPVTGIGGLTRVALNEQFLAPGDHEIIVQATPLSAQGGEWFLRGQIVAVSPAGTSDVIKQFDWSARTGDIATNSKPLPIKSARVRISTTQGGH